MWLCWNLSQSEDNEKPPVSLRSSKDDSAWQALLERKPLTRTIKKHLLYIPLLCVEIIKQHDTSSKIVWYWVAAKINIYYPREIVAFQTPYIQNCGLHTNNCSTGILAFFVVLVEQRKLCGTNQKLLSLQKVWQSNCT